MNFARIRGLILVGTMILGLAACWEKETSLAGGQGKAPQEEGSSAAQAAVGTINVHATWPLASEVVDVPIADNVYRENYMLVIDTSGSMGDRCGGQVKLETAKIAGANFIDNIPMDAAIGLVQFGNGSGNEVEVVVPLGANQHQAVRSAIANLRSGGGTPMAGGIYAGYQELLRGASAQLGYGAYEMVILADGRPSSARGTINNIDYLVRQTRVGVTTIGFCTDLKEVMEREGVSYYTASSLAELSAAFRSVLAEAETFADIQF